MTAFAREEYRGDLGEMSWEIRSVNHRYLEAFLRLPEELRVLETVVREHLAARLGRGKLDVALKYKPSAESEAGIQVNHRLVEQLVAADLEVANILHVDSCLKPIDLLRWPGVLQEQARDFTPVKKLTLELLDKTLESLVANRQREGERLGEIVLQRCRSLQGQVDKVRTLMPDVLEGVKAKIRERLQEFMEELDEARLEQEMALLAQRLDVDEEMDRLAGHLIEVERVLTIDEPVGRRLDFLMQELNREANTLSSKSNNLEVTRIGVEMKVLVEQMREQIQNIE
jgi:uncharacterized protein (TIGR00255 family)